MKKLAFIDALRGYAVLGVLLVHTGQVSGFPDAPVAAGARGVQLFFVVSALTLMLSWHHRNDGAGPFLIRRAFRILPMFWLSIPLYLSGPVDWQIVAAALLLQASRPDWLFAPIVPGGWSICAEAAFYLVFPVLAATVTSAKRATMLLAAAALVAVLWRYAGMKYLPLVYPDASRDELWVFNQFTFPSQFVVFAEGVLCFFLIPGFAKLRRVQLEIILWSALCGAAFSSVYKPHLFPAFGGFFAIVAACMANGAGRILINPAISWIGRCSFSIYILQWLAIGHAQPIADHFEGAAKLIVLLTGTVILATAMSSATYLLIERPMIRLGNLLLARTAEPKMLPSNAPSV